jgi:hypothetical protein
MPYGVDIWREDFLRHLLHAVALQQDRVGLLSGTYSKSGACSCMFTKGILLSRLCTIRLDL